MLAATFKIKDEKGKVIGWDCEAYKMFLNQAAGNGGVLNREEFLGALEKLKNETPDKPPVEPPVVPPVKPPVIPDEELCSAERGKEADTYEEKLCWLLLSVAMQTKFYVAD